jgi:hypothetical protein
VVKAKVKIKAESISPREQSSTPYLNALLMTL